uniref:F-box domain-containing protein n=1 Tax=Mycena chlorophos TaxID=658473 RepID=A0ABQ0KUS0_MYCCL|nr:predicted protein [Mycena chlorophos]
MPHLWTTIEVEFSQLPSETNDPCRFSHLARETRRNSRYTPVTTFSFTVPRCLTPFERRLLGGTLRAYNFRDPASSVNEVALCLATLPYLERLHVRLHFNVDIAYAPRLVEDFTAHLPEPLLVSTTPVTSTTRVIPHQQVERI